MSKVKSTMSSTDRANRKEMIQFALGLSQGKIWFVLDLRNWCSSSRLCDMDPWIKALQASYIMASNDLKAKDFVLSKYRSDIIKGRSMYTNLYRSSPYSPFWFHNLSRFTQDHISRLLDLYICKRFHPRFIKNCKSMHTISALNT